MYLSDNCVHEDVKKMATVAKKIQPKSGYKPNMKYKSLINLVY